jgi:hypothetical protein
VGFSVKDYAGFAWAAGRLQTSLLEARRTDRKARKARLK